jgi:hypothetical protein
MAPYWIMAFFALGGVFGLVTFRHRHFFSEGPSRAPASVGDGAGERMLWLCIAATLWPVLALTGLYGAWRRSLRR